LESGRGGNEKRDSPRRTKSELGCGASRNLHAAQNRSQHARRVVGRADVAGSGLQGRHPHLLIRDTVGADNRQFRVVVVETFYVREHPLLNVKYNSLGMAVRQLVPKFLARIDELYGKVRPQSTCQGPSNSGIFLENDYTLAHKSPDLKTVVNGAANV